MKRVLGLIFNRWTLAALLLATWIALVWLIGPLVAVAQWRPLESSGARWAASLGLVAVVALVQAWRLWRSRHGNERIIEQLRPAPAAQAESADMAAVRERFEQALTTLRSARFGTSGTKGWWSGLRQRLSGRYLYELPWYLIVGAPGSGKTTALRNAGLNFPLATQPGDEALRGVAGSRDCNWWFSDRAVLIDTVGRFTTQDSDPGNDKNTWAGFLALLKRTRPRQPLNGVLVTASVYNLLTDTPDKRAEYAQNVKQRLQELQAGLRMNLPVYLLVTKCDLMAGFTDSFAFFGKQQRAQPWGCTFDLQPSQAWQQALLPEFDALVQRLHDGLVDALQDERDPPRRARIYGFPLQFASVREPLEEFVRQVFSTTPYHDELLLRGVYFVSGTQYGTPLDRALGAAARRFGLEQAVAPPQGAGGSSYFLKRLLSDVVFAEQGLAGTDHRWERSRGALAVGLYTALALATLGTLAAWTVSYRHNLGLVDAVAERAQAVARQVSEQASLLASDPVPLMGVLDATRQLASADLRDRQAPWAAGLGLDQGDQLDSAARQAYERMLRQGLLPRLAMRLEEQVRGAAQAESQYEALKAYLMLYDGKHFNADALKAHVEADWDARQVRELSPEQRQSLSTHLGVLLQQGLLASPLRQDRELVAAARAQLAAVPLPRRVYNRLRVQGLGAEYPEFNAVRVGGPQTQLVFTRASGAPLTRGVPGLFSHEGYHKGFQSVVADATRQLAEEQVWVLGIDPGRPAGTAVLDAVPLTDEVRRLYLNEYRDTWKTYIADLRLQPVTSVATALQLTRSLAAADSPLVPLMRAMSRHTTLLEGGGAVGQWAQKTQDLTRKVQQAIVGVQSGNLPGGAALAGRIESIVDDEFIALRRYVSAPEGGKPPIEVVAARLGELQHLLSAVDTALKSGSPPPPSALPNQIRVDAANAPDPLRSVLDSLGSASARVALIQLRESLSREVRAQVGEFCLQAVAGRYPFDPMATREVTPADFTLLFGPGGKFDQMQQRLAPYVNTSTRPWSFRPVDGVPLGTDAGSLPQFQRAAAIRETFFAGGAATPSTRLEFRPVEMDTGLRVFTLDVDGQQVRYDHGPQIPQPVRWPGAKGSNVVRVMVEPAVGAGLANDGAWALFRLFDRVAVTPGASSESFRVRFDIAGLKAVFDVTANSVRNPFRLPELRTFACPNGL